VLGFVVAFLLLVGGGFWIADRVGKDEPTSTADIEHRPQNAPQTKITPDFTLDIASPLYPMYTDDVVGVAISDELDIVTSYFVNAVTRQEIWHRTGLARSVDDQYVVFVPDNDATSVAVVETRTGTVVAESFDHPQAWLMGFGQGMVAIEDHLGGYVYRLTDLSTPVWTYEASNWCEQWVWAISPWVLTDAGYRDIATGEPTFGACTPDNPFTISPNQDDRSADWLAFQQTWGAVTQVGTKTSATEASVVRWDPATDTALWSEPVVANLIEPENIMVAGDQLLWLTPDGAELRSLDDGSLTTTIPVNEAGLFSQAVHFHEVGKHWVVSLEVESGEELPYEVFLIDQSTGEVAQQLQSYDVEVSDSQAFSVVWSDSETRTQLEAWDANQKPPVKDWSVNEPYGYLARSGQDLIYVVSYTDGTVGVIFLSR
jgi:hypothetical protein